MHRRKLAFGRQRDEVMSVQDAPSCLVGGDDWSGFNGELIEGEKYSGAWRTTTSYFDKVGTDGINNLEGGSHLVVAGNTKATVTSTRDHLDFFVLHLSAYSSASVRSFTKR
jgi:hypothetical protein